MSRIVKIATPMFAAVLVAGALVGCGGQAASSSASASAASASASASASATAPASPSAETQANAEETVAQLKEAMENAKDFKSVTITHNVGVEVDASQLTKSESAQSASSEAADSASAQSASSEAAESDESAESTDASDTATAEDTSLNTTTVYKFDQSGDAVKSSSTSDFQGSTFKSYLDGDKATVEVGGNAFAGTVQEMSAHELTSIDELLKTKVGDFEAITSCVSAADVEKQGDNTVYALVIDADKYTETDEIEKALAKAGLKKEVFTVSYEFGADGKLLSVSVNTTTPIDTTQATLRFTDYDATVVDQAPETDKTYADMSAEMQKTIDAIANEEREALQSK